MENDKDTIKKYLELAGVSKTIIYYLDKEPGIILQLKDYLGEDFISGMNILQEKCVEKLKKGNEDFRILENGNIWFLSSYKPKSIKISSKLYTGFLSKNENYILIQAKNYISIEGDKLYVRKVEEKQKSENVFDGQISECIYEQSLKLMKRTTGYWFSLPRGIPNKELNLDVEEFNEFGFSKRTMIKGNCNTFSWNFVYNGEKLERKNNSIEEKSGIKEKLKRLKSILVSKKVSIEEDMKIDRK